MSVMMTGGNGFRRMAALACLLAFSLGPVQFLPAVFALAAGVEGSHTVLISSVAEGGTKVALRHVPGAVSGRSRTAIAHRHGLASKVICLMAGSPRVGGDHVVSFAAGGAVEGAQKALRVQSRSPDQQPGRAAVPGQVTGESGPFASDGAQAGCPRANPHSILMRQRCQVSMCLLI